MKKINIIKSNDEYNRIIKNIKPYKTRELIVFIEKKQVDKYRFGFSVSKKIGNAVTRNKIKRQLKSILDKNIYENNFNCIIIVRKGYLDSTYLNIEKSLTEIVKKFRITKEEKSEE